MNRNDAQAGNDSIIPHFDDEIDHNLKIRLQQIRNIPNCLVFYLTGCIDITNANYFKSHVGMAMEAGFIRLIFSTKGMFMVTSIEINSYIAFLKEIKPRGGDLVFIEMPPKVYETYRLLGFASIFAIRDSLNEAISYFTAAGDRIFPMTLRCPICAKSVKATKAGRSRCPECRTVLVIDKSGHVSLD